jgi:SAM-dependent methyltransferase
VLEHLSSVKVLTTLRGPVKDLLYGGTRRECPCCHRQARRFLTFGRPPRTEAKCPFCGSLERHRLLMQSLRQRHVDLSGRVLHFAPEPALRSALAAVATNYVTTDLFATDVDVQADITDLPFEDNSWDLIFCSHILEHIEDDATAMRELRRVISNDGAVVVMVPRNSGVPTDEDFTVTTPAGRLARFGQEDHVRIYGDDLEARLTSAGFKRIEAISPSDFPPEMVSRMRLQPEGGRTETAMYCFKS